MTERSGFTSGRTRAFIERVLVFGSLILLCGMADGSWLKHVPADKRMEKNPYSGQSNAIAAGQKLFLDHCASCHGKDELGHGKKPGLRTERVQHATDGELFWLLRNGDLARGMPSWSKLPDESRWQVVAFLKSLGVSPAPQNSASAPRQ